MQQDDGFETLGPRVPAIVASPYVVPGSVIGAKQGVQLDHCSVLKFICEWQGLDPNALSRRVAHPDTMSLRMVLSDTSQAQALVPPAAVSVPAALPVATANELSELQKNFRALKGHIELNAHGAEHKPLQDWAARIP